jgi:hypothetical protein
LPGRYAKKYIAAAPNAMSPTLSMTPPMMALVEDDEEEEEDEAAADYVLLVVSEVVAAGSERVGRRGWIPDRCRFSPNGAQ